jgi:hypothetical protein
MFIIVIWSRDKILDLLNNLFLYNLSKGNIRSNFIIFLLDPIILIICTWFGFYLFLIKLSKSYLCRPKTLNINLRRSCISTINFILKSIITRSNLSLKIFLTLLYFLLIHLIISFCFTSEKTTFGMTQIWQKILSNLSLGLTRLNCLFFLL